MPCLWPTPRLTGSTYSAVLHHFRSMVHGLEGGIDGGQIGGMVGFIAERRGGAVRPLTDNNMPVLESTGSDTEC